MFLLLASGSFTAAYAQANAAPDGAAVFTRACATCHKPGQSEVPAPEVLRALTPEAIVNSLTNGKMAVQGSTLTTAERAAVAQFLTGRARPRPAATRHRAESLHGGHADDRPGPRAELDGLGERRHQLPIRAAGRAHRGGPSEAEVEVGVRVSGRHVVARAARARGREAVCRQRQRRAPCTRSKDRLHVLDLQSGVGRPKRVAVGPTAAGRAGYAVFFGDQRANAYAVDTVTGQQIWKRKVDEHQAAAITGAIAIQDGKAFVAVQGLNEEGTGGRGQTPCCTFRGNLNALDANTGAFLWKTYTVDEPKLRGRNTRSGQDAFGPAGGGIWSAPTVDVKRRAVYVSTGNAYADPPQPMTDAVIAMNIGHRQDDVGLSRRRRTTTGSAAAAREAMAIPAARRREVPITTSRRRRF